MEAAISTEELDAGEEVCFGMPGSPASQGHALSRGWTLTAFRKEGGTSGSGPQLV